MKLTPLPPADQPRNFDAVARDPGNKVRRDGSRGQLYALEIPTAVIVGAVLGSLADSRLGIAPWGITVGLIAGVGYAARSVYRIIQWYRTIDPPTPQASNTPDDGAPHG